jgi:hypothetical protein
LNFYPNGTSAGIANTSDDQSTAWRVPHFVLLEERCCAAPQDADSNSNALRATTNSSTQHERNTDLRASFTWDTDTILNDPDAFFAVGFVVILFLVLVGKLLCWICLPPPR